MLEFREQFLSSKPAATFKELGTQKITPEGVQIRCHTAKETPPSHKGVELIDGDAEESYMDHLEDLKDNG